VDAQTGEPLGVVCRREAGAGSWWRWLAAPVLEVREADDEPLLCTLRRFWSLAPLWEVRDADDNLVATLYRGRIEDRSGERWALLEPAAGGAAVRFVAGPGVELAALTRDADGLRLTFADGVKERPLAKMAILGAALTVKG
jgi:hypothetical protein